MRRYDNYDYEEAFKKYIDDTEEERLENVINALTKGYTTIGFARGRTVMSKLLTFLLKSKLVVKCGNNEYCRMKDYPSLPLLEGQEVKK